MQEATLLATRILKFAFLFAAICVFSTLSPSMPGHGLDPSWRFAMNEIVGLGLAFGKDVSFSFGPYSAIYTREYHPATDHYVLAASIFLGLAYWFAATRFLRSSQWPIVIGFIVILSGVISFRDALLLSYPLLTGIWTFNVLEADRQHTGLKSNRILEGILIFLPLGLLPLVKGSCLVPSAGIALLSFVWLGRYGRFRLALSGAATVVIGSILFWLISGQVLCDLPEYFIAMLPITSGYTDAMSIDGPTDPIKYYLAASLIMLAWILTRSTTGRMNRVLLALCIGLYLFVAFKAGFVRNDVHAVFAATSMLLGALALALAISDRLYGVVLIAALLAWHSVDKQYTNASTNLLGNISRSVKSALTGLDKRLTDKAWPKAEYDDALQAIMREQPLPRLAGNSDIYSFNQALLIASGNRWNPRPIPQSYSVYTPMLVQRNLRHLTSETRPDNIFFKVETIDGRFPSLDDGASWPALLGFYTPAGTAGDYLLLRKRGNSALPLALRHLSAGTHRFSQSVTVPAEGRAVFVKIMINPTISGRIASLLYKSSQLQIEVALANESRKTFRLIGAMASTGFVLSPVVSARPDLEALFVKGEASPDRTVRSFTIRPIDGTRFWKEEYAVEFSALD
jgi:hypothetical protein